MANTYFRGPDDPSYGDMYNIFFYFSYSYMFMKNYSRFSLVGL